MADLKKERIPVPRDLLEKLVGAAYEAALGGDEYFVALEKAARELLEAPAPEDERCPACGSTGDFWAGFDAEPPEDHENHPKCPACAGTGMKMDPP